MSADDTGLCVLSEKALGTLYIDRFLKKGTKTVFADHCFLTEVSVVDRDDCAKRRSVPSSDGTSVHGRRRCPLTVRPVRCAGP